MNKFDKVICVDNAGFENKLEKGGLYTVKAFSARNAEYNPDGIKLYEVKPPCGKDGYKLDRFVKVDRQMIDVLNVMCEYRPNCV